MEQKPLKILLVEDDEDDAFYIKDLIREGMPGNAPEIDHTPNFDDAVKFLDKTTYDLCMFDYRLGEVDGIDLLRTIRSKGVASPIIFLTGQGDQEVAVEAMKAGATDYLVKRNLSSESLTHSIRYAIGLHNEAERRRQAEEMLKNSHEDLTVAHSKLQDSMQKLKTAQNQILRSEKLAGIGRLAAGVCHEILNPLNIIAGHSQALLMERQSDQPLLEDLNSIMKEIHRIEKIIGGLLKFSRKGDMELKYVNIHGELESVLTILEKEMILDGIHVVRDFTQDLPELLIDSDRMRQVFLNIINNAKYAMNEGGTFTITTEKQVPAASTANGDMRSLRIKFSDTGAGIKKEDMGKIFEPFFTTKPEDKGTGLGLSVCYTIVEKHGGNIEVESEEGKGTTFILDFPFHEGRGNDPAFLDEPA